MQSERLPRSAPAVPALGASRIRRGIKGGRVVGAAAAFAFPAALIVLLAWPMLFTDRGFNEDWLHHLWFMWNQSRALRETGHPSFFLHSANSVFYPIFAFYGGTLYTLVGAVSLLLGDAPIPTYVLTYLACLGAGYGGWYWLARIAGLGGWRAMVPGTLLLTSSYYITLIYARGDLPELVGVSLIPLLVASGISLLRADRLELRPALAFTCSTILFFGSHNLTMLWGSTLLAVVMAVAYITVPEVRGCLRRRRAVLRIAVIGAAGLLVNAWFLLPTVAYESHTLISHGLSHWEGVLRSTQSTVAAHHLFTISRASAFSSTSAFALSLPVLAMAWVVVVLLTRWRRGPRDVWTRMMLICAGVAVVVTVLMTHASLIVALPRPYPMLQFSYRLESYIVLAVAGAVLAGLAAAQRAPRNQRFLAWALAPIMVVAIVGAIQQVSAAPHGLDRHEALASPFLSNFSHVIPIDYGDAHLPVRVDRYGVPPALNFPPSGIHGDHMTVAVHLYPGQWIYSNIGAGPEFVHITGAKVIGVNHLLRDVLRVGAGKRRASGLGGGGAPWTEVISVSPAHPLPIVLGRWLSFVAIAFLLVAFTLLATRRLRAWGRPRALGE